HMHLDILVARATSNEPMPFWNGWSRLQKEYDQRLPA
ncbi:MAG: ATPase, partial [Alphaproteobacteria bacterium]